MREKELRLAVVLTGGVSLAIYMHGVTKELLKLIRASKVYHSEQDLKKRKAESYASLNKDPDRDTDTEDIYFELLQELAQEVELRTVIDVISGASAGGVNGVMLARALAHDLPLDAHKPMWLEHADVLELLDEKNKAGRWSKFYLEPLLRGPFYKYFDKLAPEQETREKLFTFMKSRWFSPPFSGKKFSHWIFEGAERMAQGVRSNQTLMPDGHELDLFVNVTDFQGHNRVVELHDPARAVETEHRLRLRFNFVKMPDGEVRSDFSNDMIPSLVFAARATSSFPGAFPAMTFREIDEVVKERGVSWKGRERFIETNFRPLYKGGRDPERAFYIDGSTVNDKPFAVAISALTGRPAHREVVRRLLFVDPEADVGETARQINIPSMFRVLLGALMEIPRNEPVRDELERLNKSNRKARMLRNVIELSRPRVNEMVEQILDNNHLAPTMGQLQEWRRSAHEKTAEEAGLAYESYFRLKLSRVLNRIESLFKAFLQDEGRDDLCKDMRRKLKDWMDLNISALQKGGKVKGGSDISFLKNFDVDFYIRRLRFVIQRLNEFYHISPFEREDRDTFSGLDEIKNALYQKLNEAARLWERGSYPSDLKKQTVSVFEGKNTESNLSDLFTKLADHIGLGELDYNADEIFSIMLLNYAAPDTRRELLTAYIGFSFFDLLSFPLVQEEDLIELDEVLIHRISTKDAKSLHGDGKPLKLKGRILRNFGGFFNRSFREHDYLIGRLTAADRLVDMILDLEIGLKEKLKLDGEKLKRKLFSKILDAEAVSLTQDPNLISQLKERLL